MSKTAMMMNSIHSADFTDFCWAHFKKMVFYGYTGWPSFSYWIVPGTITDIDRA